MRSLDLSSARTYQNMIENLTFYPDKNPSERVLRTSAIWFLENNPHEGKLLQIPNIVKVKIKQHFWGFSWSVFDALNERVLFHGGYFEYKKWYSCLVVTSIISIFQLCCVLYDYINKGWGMRDEGWSKDWWMRDEGWSKDWRMRDEGWSKDWRMWQIVKETVL